MLYKISRILRAMAVSGAMMLLTGSGIYASTISDSLRFRILFPINSATVQRDFEDNDAILTDFINTYREIAQDRNVSDIRFTLSGSASLEGNTQKNQILAGRRAESIAAWLAGTCSVADSLITVLPGQSMRQEASALLSTFPASITGIDIAGIRRISGKVNGLQLKQAFVELDGVVEGRNWNWYLKNILEPTRYADICLYYKRPVQQAQPAVVAPDPALAVDSTVVAPAVMPVPLPVEPEPEPEKQPEIRRSECRIGTNLLYDVVTVANLSFEVGFARHMALNLFATFSPWDIRVPDVKLRSLILQPELRWYFGNDFIKHYVGVEGHYGWYNVALGGRTRYQDRDGDTPLWGAGLSYGYVLPIAKHFGMDFSISAGYAHLVYDCFYNIKNGAKYTTQSRDWWGPTRIGVSIYYQF